MILKTVDEDGNMKEIKAQRVAIYSDNDEPLGAFIQQDDYAFIGALAGDQDFKSILRTIESGSDPRSIRIALSRKRE